MEHEVENSHETFRGAIVTVRVDTVRMPDGSSVDREVVEHADSVGVVALDDAGRVLLMRQYRHPLAAVLVEIPAGLCDTVGELPLDTARRELREEGGVLAERWRPLLTVHASPGISTEKATIYLADRLRLTDPDPQGAEERDIELEWVPLDDALQLVRDGRITDSLAVSGLLGTADHLARATTPRPGV